MEKIIKSTPKRPVKSQTINSDSQLFKTILTALQNKKAEKIVSLNLTNIEEAVTDFFFICEVESNVQMETLQMEVEKLVWEECHEKPYQAEIGEEWTLLDYINIVVHIFKPESRRFYDLEGLWIDSERIEHGDSSK